MVSVNLGDPGWREALAEVSGPIGILGIGLIATDEERHAEVLRVAREYPIGVGVRPVPGVDTSFLQDLQNVQAVYFSPGRDEDFANITHMSDLRYLGAYVNVDANEGEQGRISDAALEHISGLTQLRHIEFLRSAIQGSGLVHLSAMSELRILNLSTTPLSEGLEHLSDLSKLEELNLRGTEVDDDDVSHLSTLENLQILELGGTVITDGCTPTIGQLTELRYLNIGFNDITDAGLPPLIRLPNLEFISLGLTLVTDFGVMMFREDIEVRR